MMGLADHICERASIGQVVVSPLDEGKDPELMAEFEDLSDDEFKKRSLRYYSERDVFAFSTILSLNWNLKRGKRQLPFLKSIQDYAISKSTKHCNKGQVQEFKRILDTKNVGLLMAERMINLPAEIVPCLHTELPEDLAFTKEQDDIENPKEFDYDYLLVLSRYTIPVKQSDGDPAATSEKLYYKWEDTVLWPASDISFTFKATFRQLDAEGNKVSVTGSQDGREYQCRLIYLIKYDRYLQEIKKLAPMTR